MNMYTQEQVRHLLLALLLGNPFPCQDESGSTELIPVHDVSIEHEATDVVRVNIGLDDVKGVTFTIPLPGPLVTRQEYMEEVLRTYAGTGTQVDKLTLGALGLAGESGEVVDRVKKMLYQGHRLDALGLLEELGDVLWYIALMCNALGWTLDDALDLNVTKLRKRYPNGFEVERSVNR